MKKIKTYLSKDIGIVLCIIFYVCFLAIARIAKPYFDGADWYFFSSAQRIIFGLAELFIFMKIFHKGKWTDVIYFTNFKDGIRAGSGLIHAMECDNFGDAIDKFIVTGIFGFVFASVYLYSHNILVPMLLHFIYDIAANFQQFVDVWNEESSLFHVLNNYVLTAAFILMFIVSLLFVVKRPAYESHS